MTTDGVHDTGEDPEPAPAQSEAERSALMSRADIRAYSAGETIFLKGSPGSAMMVLLDGSESGGRRSRAGGPCSSPFQERR